MSDTGTGTTVRALFHTNHADMKPFGDVEGTVSILKACHPEIEFTVEGVGE